MSGEQTSERQESRNTRRWKAAKHLLPFIIVLGALLYWGVALDSEKRVRDFSNVYEGARDQLWQVSRGRLNPPITSTSREVEITRFGVAEEKINSYAIDPDRMAVVLCEAPIESDGRCPAGEARFRVAYPLHHERTGPDTWFVVLAPERNGQFTRDPFRIVYVAATGSSHHAILIDDPVVLPELEDAGIAELAGFGDSALGEEIDGATDDSGVARLNPLDLQEDEWRLHGDARHRLPYQEEIYEISRDKGSEALSWIKGDGDLEGVLGRVALVSACLAFLLMIFRFLGRFLAYTAKGIGPLMLLILERLDDDGQRE